MGSSNGSVMSVPSGGGTATTLAARQANVTAIAVDATSVYWAGNGPGGAVLSLPK
jgi:hypothetical protein